ECNMPLEKVTLDELADFLMNPVFCANCFEEYMVSPNNIYTVYKRKIKPDVSEDEINLEILKRLNFSKDENFNRADSLIDKTFDLYNAFYRPNESAYIEFKEMREALDLDYGNNTTAKGKALEELVLKLFKNVRFVRGTNEIKTYTNQFDCTIISPTATCYPSIFNLLTPYFIIECKNEPNTTPSNTYFNKLLSIMNTNEAKVGIVFSRKPAGVESQKIAYHHYLLEKKSSKGIYMISMCDNDLKTLIDEQENLLKLIDYKIMELTTNARNASFEMFKQTYGKRVK
ncbi:MAG TPA: hypothetical protein VF941_08795, partial [Clostridia bacterium]